MDISDLVFTAFNKRVAALDRDTGEIVWQWKAPSGETYASLLLDGDRLIVCIHGYMYALNAANGRLLWANDMWLWLRRRQPRLRARQPQLRRPPAQLRRRIRRTVRFGGSSRAQGGQGGAVPRPRSAW